MKKISYFISSVLFLTLIFAGCKDPNQDKISNEAFEADIDTSKTFDAGKTYYINHEVYITNNAEVVCNGAIFKFGPKGSLTVKAGSKLTATETTFTSVNDESAGDTIADSTGIPAPNDWIGIVIDGGVASFTNCEFKYGGKEYKKSGHYSVLYSDKDSGNNKGPKGKMKVEGCSFTKNGGKDAHVGGTAAVTFGTNAAAYSAEDNYIKSCTFTDNLWPLCIPTDFSLPDSTNKYISNKYNDIYVQFDNERKVGHNATDSAPQKTVWAYQTVPYCYMHESYDLEIMEYGTLEIGPGAASDKPTKILFNGRGIKLNTSDVGAGKVATLKLTSNTVFENYNTATTWKGIFSWNGSKYGNLYKSNTKDNIYINIKSDCYSDKVSGTQIEIKSGDNH